MNENYGLKNTAYFKYARFYHETYIKLLLGIHALHSLLNFYFVFSLFIFAFTICV